MGRVIAPRDSLMPGKDLPLLPEPVDSVTPGKKQGRRRPIKIRASVPPSNRTDGFPVYGFPVRLPHNREQ